MTWSNTWTWSCTLAHRNQPVSTGALGRVLVAAGGLGVCGCGFGAEQPPGSGVLARGSAAAFTCGVLRPAVKVEVVELSLSPPRCRCPCSLSVVALRFSQAGRWDSAGRFCSRSASRSHAQSALPGRPQAVVSQNAPHCHDRLGFWQSRALKLQHLCAQAVLPVRRAPASGAVLWAGSKLQLCCVGTQP